MDESKKRFLKIGGIALGVVVLIVGAFIITSKLASDDGAAQPAEIITDETIDEANEDTEAETEATEDAEAETEDETDAPEETEAEVTPEEDVETETDVEESNYTGDADIQAVVDALLSLHDFSAPDDTIYEDAVNALDQQNVELSGFSDEIYTQYAPVNTEAPLAVTAGIVMDHSVIEKGDTVEIVVTSRMGTSPTQSTEGEQIKTEEVQKNLRDFLADDEYADLETTAVYQLSIGDEGQVLERIN